MRFNAITTLSGARALRLIRRMLLLCSSRPIPCQRSHTVRDVDTKRGSNTACNVNGSFQCNLIINQRKRYVDLHDQHTVLTKWFINNY